MLGNRRRSISTAAFSSQVSNAQFALLLRQLLQLKHGGSESTVLVIAFISFLSFLAAGMFGIFSLLIPQYAKTEPIQTMKTVELKIVGTIQQAQPNMHKAD